MAGLLDDIGTNATGLAPGIDLQLGICMGIPWGISGHTHTHTHQYPYPPCGYGYVRVLHGLRNPWVYIS